MSKPRQSVDTSTKRLTKQELLNRQLQEGKLKVDRSELEAGAPEWLSEEAAIEYNRIVSEAKKIDLYDNLDLSMLAIYADCYARYVEAVRYLKEHGSVEISNGKKYTSPYVTIADKLGAQMIRCSARLGIAAADRLRLVVPIKEEKGVNKFLEFVK